MKAFNPVTITELIIRDTNLPEHNDPGVVDAWEDDVTYDEGDRCYSVNTHKVYESIADGNLDKNPTTEQEWWVEVGPTNLWAMLDQITGSVTQASGELTILFDLSMGGEVDSLVLLNLVADHIRINIFEFGVGSLSLSPSPSASPSPSGGASYSSSISSSPSSSTSVSSSISASPSASISGSPSGSPSWGFDSDMVLMAVAHSTSPYVTMYDTLDWSKIPDLEGLPAGSFADALDFSPDGSLLAVAPSTSPRIAIYNTYDWSKLTDPSTLPTSFGQDVTFNPDGSLLAMALYDSPYIIIYDTSDWSKLSDPSTLPNGNARTLDFNPDGSLLAVGHLQGPYVTIYDTSDWSKLSNPSTLPPNRVQGVAFSPDGSLLAVGHYSSPYITIYNTSDWSKLSDPSVLPGGTCGIKGVAFSPDGSLLAVGHYDYPYITIYNTSDWSKLPNPSSLPFMDVSTVAFSPDGSLLCLTHFSSPYLTIYKTYNWSKVSNPDTLPTGFARDVAFFDYSTIPCASPSSSVSESVGPGGSYWEYNEDLNIDPEFPESYLKLDIPVIPATVLRVTLTGENIEVGTLAYGNLVDLGATLWGLHLGITDYSTKEADTFGNISVIERAYSKRLTCDLFFEHSDLRAIYQFLAEVRATACVWVSSEDEDFDAVVLYGFYKDFSIVLRDYGGCYCSLELEGLI